MRRMIPLMLVLLLVGAAALAEADGLNGGWRIDPSNPLSVDLNGDGTPETVTYALVPDEYEEHLQIQVTADGAELTYDTDILCGEGVWACDLDGDGLVEIFAWGDVMSDDYYTYCVQYANGILKPVLFADVERGTNGNGYYKSGYGMLVAADPAAGTVTLCGSQDMLGTYFMNRTLRLDADGLFEYGDDGWWRRDVTDILNDPDSWEYAALTLKGPMACRIDGRAAMLGAGDRIIITGTDKETLASFITTDGREGQVAVSENYERGWGTLVDGVAEEELFDFVPYAD